MATRDGNGWMACGLGHRHWGRHGAAGLLAYAYADGSDGGVSVLLQRRSEWSHHGGTWGLPGGAMDSHESVVEAALREAAEECGIPADAVTVGGILRDDHGTWCYWTVIGRSPATFPVHPASAETTDAAWVREAQVDRLDLHPGFAAQWPALRKTMRPLTIIVDAANVMGSRPDGWWRDRAGAALRLRDELASLAARGIAGLPAAVDGPALERWFPDFVLVVEGAARGVATGASGSSGGRVRVVAAAGSGDDVIAALAGETPGRRLAVTADRELRGRCLAAGASVTGPSWLLGLL